MDRPFDPSLWREAEALAGRYQFTVKYDSNEPYFYAFGVEARGCMGGGSTLEECHADIRRAMALWVGTMLENGEKPPRPLTDLQQPRTQQLNIRLTEGEKHSIEEAAYRAGFRGVSDFVRAAALEKAV